MKTKIAVGLLAIAILAYLGIASERAYRFFVSGSLVGQVIAIAILMVSAIGGYLLYREIKFGFQVQKLLALAAAEGIELDANLPLAPSGKPDRDAADAEFARLQETLPLGPQSWQDWLRVSVAYDNSRDSKRARAAMRTAIKLAAL